MSPLGAVYSLFVLSLVIVVLSPKWIPRVSNLLWTFRYRGDPIMVVFGRVCIEARIISRRDDTVRWEPDWKKAQEKLMSEFARSSPNFFNVYMDLLNHTSRVHLADEGITWAWGWDTLEAKALLVAEALA